MEMRGLTEKTIKAHLKHFGLKIKNEFVYKDNFAIYTEDLTRRTELLRFLEGMSVVYDNRGLFGLRWEDK